MSNSSPSAAATCFVITASRLTPRLMLPDFMIAVFFAASAIFASSAGEQPVVPMMCARCVSAASAASFTVAAGIVKSRMASAAMVSGRTSLVTTTRFGGKPASTPESWPRCGEPSPAVAPTSARPGVSAIALMSVRPMRPPAPATISPMSDMTSSVLRGGYSDAQAKCQLGLRAVVALDHDDIAGRMRRAQLDRGLIFGRVVASKRGRIVLELEHDIARADLALGILELAAAHQEFRTVFAQGLGIRCDVVLIAVRIADIDVDDPVAFRHRMPPCFLFRRLILIRKPLPIRIKSGPGI